jgi:tetratricopeptide (TPR) repeat protein
MNPAEVNQREKAIDQALAAGDLDQAEVLANAYQAAAGLVTRHGEAGRSPSFRAAYLAGQVALAAGRLRLAVERLSPLLDVTDRLPGELAGRIRLLLAEALARLNRSAEAGRLLEQMPAAVLDREPLLQLRALLIRLWLGEVERLGEELTACARVLEARGETANLALLLSEEGRAWEKAGDLSRAGRCWQRAETLSRAAGPGAIRADVLLQLGRLDHLHGRLGPALERYEAALGQGAQGAQVLEIRLRRLLVLLDLGQWDQARAGARDLFDGRPWDCWPEEVRTLGEMVHGLLADVSPAEATDEVRAYQATARGDLGEARTLYRAALARAPAPERQARLALALGLLALAQADRAEAGAWLSRAEELARSLDLPEVLGRAL